MLFFAQDLLEIFSFGINLFLILILFNFRLSFKLLVEDLFFASSLLIENNFEGLLILLFELMV